MSMGRAMLVVVLALLAPGAVLAAATVEVVEVWPAGEALVVAPGQNVYLRMRYTTDAPARIWARPMLRGAAANAGSHPSPLYPPGSGEALGWFFFHEAGLEADAIRVSAGTGGRDTPVLVTLPLEVRSANVASAGTPPAWVARLKAEAEALQDENDRQRAAQQDDGSVAGAIADVATGLLLGLIPLLLLLMIGVPAWGLWRWRGGWRLAAAVPAVVMGLVLLNIIVGVAIDPTSHNLWPFEILMVGSAGLVWMLVLGVARRVRGVSGRKA